MKWPFVSRALHETAVAALAQRAEASEQREAYWRERAERYIDLGMARVGAAHEPVMSRDGGPPQDAMAVAMAGIGMMSFDSTKS